VEQATGQTKKERKKSASIGITGYDQMTVEPLCTSKLQTFENFS